MFPDVEDQGLLLARFYEIFIIYLFNLVRLLIPYKFIPQFLVKY